MAARRMLKNWTESDKVDALSAGAEVFFTRLIMVADDYGSFPENVVLLKSKCFPLKKEVKTVKIAEWLDELITTGIVFRYSVDEKTYIRIRDFDQRVQSKKNIYPHPPQIHGDPPKKTVTHGEQTPEEKRREEEVEEELKKKEKENGRTLEWFEKLFDEIWIGNIKSIHPGKDIPQAIREAYGHIADTPRLKIIDPGGAKRLVNTWLSNTKEQKPPNGKNIRHRAEPIAGKSFGKL